MRESKYFKLKCIIHVYEIQNFKISECYLKKNNDDRKFSFFYHNIEHRQYIFP